jgi:hypothetical protein
VKICVAKLFRYHLSMALILGSWLDQVRRFTMSGCVLFINCSSISGGPSFDEQQGSHCGEHSKASRGGASQRVKCLAHGSPRRYIHRTQGTQREMCVRRMVVLLLKYGASRGSYPYHLITVVDKPEYYRLRSFSNWWTMPLGRAGRWSIGTLR